MKQPYNEAIFEQAISHLSTDPALKRLIEKVGVVNWTVGGDPLQHLLSAVVSQQLSIKAAETIHNRLLAAGGSSELDPNWILSQSAEQLRTVGISGQKAGYLHAISAFHLEYNLNKTHLDSMSDEEIITLLTQIKGVGKWTVEMLLMFCLGRLDVFPIDDLGVLQEAEKLVQTGLSGKAQRQALIAYSERWSPYRSIASRYLWAGRGLM